MPLHWTSSACGGAIAGETYEDAALRELKEELGIDASLRFVMKVDMPLYLENAFITLFEAVHNGPFAFPPQEVEAVKLFSRDALKILCHSDEKISLFFRHLFDVYLTKNLTKKNFDPQTETKLQGFPQSF